MNKAIRSSLMFSALLMVVILIQDLVQGSLLSTAPLNDIAWAAVEKCKERIPQVLVAALLVGYLWNENENFSLQKRIVYRVLITTLILMVVYTFYTLIFYSQYISVTAIQYFFTNIESAFIYACVYTLVWIALPDDPKKPVKDDLTVLDKEVEK